MKEGEETDTNKKADALREIQNRIMALEAQITGMKGAEMENIRAVAKEEIKTLQEEVAALTAKLTSPPAAEKSEDGIASWLPW